VPLRGGDSTSHRPSDSPWNLDRIAELEKQEELDELQQLDTLIESYERTGGPPNIITDDSVSRDADGYLDIREPLSDDESRHLYEWFLSRRSQEKSGKVLLPSLCPRVILMEL